MRFIKLTRLHYDKEFEIWINADNIATIEASDCGTNVILNHTYGTVVKETPKEIFALIKEAK